MLYEVITNALSVQLKYDRAPGIGASDEHVAVVLVHGLWLSGWSLLLLRRHLHRCGFSATHTFSYSSVGRDLLENGTALNAYLLTLSATTVHLVGHSLGVITSYSIHYTKLYERSVQAVAIRLPC